VIRHVQAGEAERVREIRLRSLAADPDAFGSTHARETSYTPDWWERIAALSDAGEDQRTFVDAEGDAWLGMMLVRRDPECSGDAVINAVWVAPEARGRGIARALTEACVAWARERGCGAVHVAVVVGNAAAQRTYEAAGFVAAGRTRWERHGRAFDEQQLIRKL
jgi:ribosomal protein S18 acetylase RimI-like enzyme